MESMRFGKQPRAAKYNTCTGYITHNHTHTWTVSRNTFNWPLK